MGQVLKWVFYLAVLTALGLVAYAYLGDFQPPAGEVRQPVELKDVTG